MSFDHRARKVFLIPKEGLVARLCEGRYHLATFPRRYRLVFRVAAWAALVVLPLLLLLLILLVLLVLLLLLLLRNFPRSPQEAFSSGNSYLFRATSSVPRFGSVRFGFYLTRS